MDEITENYLIGQPIVNKRNLCFVSSVVDL